MNFNQRSSAYFEMFTEPVSFITLRTQSIFKLKDVIVGFLAATDLTFCFLLIITIKMFEKSSDLAQLCSFDLCLE